MIGVFRVHSFRNATPTQSFALAPIPIQLPLLILFHPTQFSVALLGFHATPTGVSPLGGASRANQRAGIRKSTSKRRGIQHKV
jgi:hypothetical protein